MDDLHSAQGWDGGWEGHRRAQLLRLANLPLIEKLRWLEEAQVLLRHLHGAGEVRDRPR